MVVRNEWSVDVLEPPSSTSAGERGNGAALLRTALFLLKNSLFLVVLSWFGADGSGPSVAGTTTATEPQVTTEPQESPGGPGWFNQNLRLALDLSSRVAGDGNAQAFQNALGLDLHKVLTGSGGDWATVTAQVYLTRIDNQPMHPPFFEGEDDTELVFKIFNVNFTGITKRSFNVRVGHFETPFGLEHVINTNGTIHDFIHGRNIGVKADWGIAFNGAVGSGEYEVGISRGTGNEYTDTGDPYLLAGRLGTRRDARASFGFSALEGRILNPGAAMAWRNRVGAPAGDPRGNDGTIERIRYGVDASWSLMAFDVMADLSYGRDFDQDVANGLAELAWSSPSETVTAYLQALHFSNKVSDDWVRDVAARIGLRYRMRHNWVVSGQIQQELENPASRRHTSITLQIRHRL